MGKGGFADSGAVENERGELKLAQGLKNKMPDPLSGFTRPDIKWAGGYWVRRNLMP
jgi:hypothetical protein